jgi:hypothetical protein
MNGGLIINGVDVGVFNARIAPQPGHERGPTFNDHVLPAENGRTGDLTLDDFASLPDVARRVVLELQHATAADLLEAIDSLKALTLAAQLRVAFGDRATRCHTARCGSLEPEYFGPAQGAYDARVVLPLTLSPLRTKCTDGGEFDPTILALVVGVRTPLPAGTAPSEMRFIISGGGAAVNGFTILIRDHAGEKAYEMTFAGALTSSESLIIDSDGSAIRKLDGSTGAIADAFSFWSGTPTALNDFPVLRPGDASYDQASWATAELVAGASGTPSGTVEYVERYL